MRSNLKAIAELRYKLERPETCHFCQAAMDIANTYSLSLTELLADLVELYPDYFTGIEEPNNTCKVI